MQQIIQEEELLKILQNTLTIIIPAYNEEEVIGKTLDEISTFILRNNLSWSVIVSVDGNDSTDRVVSSYSSNFPFVSMIKSNERSGKGAAVKRVLDRINSDYIILMDADNSTNFQSITDNLSFLQEYDGIIFARYYYDNKIPLLRRFLSRSFNILVQASLGIRITDTQTGYKTFRSDIFKEGMRRVGPTNAFFDVALLFFLKQEKVRIKEVKVRYNHRKGGKFNPVSGTLGLGISLVAFRIRHSRFYKYIPESLVELYYRKLKWI
jgi:glycosyltransferase involved in cell wall biosynthesis